MRECEAMVKLSLPLKTQEIITQAADNHRTLGIERGGEGRVFAGDVIEERLRKKREDFRLKPSRIGSGIKMDQRR